jgi:sec-independent protein translocase protein TatA
VFAFGFGSPMTIVILLLLGVLLFGRNLPEMGKLLAKGIVEFKKGLGGLEDEITGSSTPRRDAITALEPPPRPPQRVTPTAPRFEDQAPPPPEAPKA